jgi:hypothetical protein
MKQTLLIMLDAREIKKWGLANGFVDTEEPKSVPLDSKFLKSCPEFLKISPEYAGKEQFDKYTAKRQYQTYVLAKNLVQSEKFLKDIFNL